MSNPPLSPGPSNSSGSVLSRRVALRIAGIGTAGLGAATLGFVRPAAARAGADAITQTASFALDPERQDEALAALEALAGAVEEHEPGVLTYAIYRVAEEPSKLFFFEVYENAAALEAHGQQPHLAKLREAFQTGLFRPPVEIVRLDHLAG